MNSLKKYLSFGLFFVSLLLFTLSLIISQGPVNTDQAAQKAGKVIQKRMATLDGFIDQALQEDPQNWLDLERLPDDMVIYKYCSDTLQSWCHQFAVTNDDISTRVVFQRLTSLKNAIISPLSDVTGQVSYVNYGPKWYLVKSISSGNTKIIAGLEIINTLDGTTYNGVNHKLRLSDRYNILPLNSSGGSPVMLGDQPLFKIISETVSSTDIRNSFLIWIALGFFIFGSLLFLVENRTMRRYQIAIVSLIIVMVFVYVSGMYIHDSFMLFSPTIYADGQFLYSLGAILIMNLTILLLVIYTFLMRTTLTKYMLEDPSEKRMKLMPGALVLSIAAIIVYTHLTFRSIVMNSSISLELYKLNEFSAYTVIVYVSYLTMLVSLPLLVQMLKPAIVRLWNHNYDVLSRRGRTVFGVLISIYFVLVSSIFGFKKEQDRVNVWANRLAMDRDIGLEIQLRSVEYSIANDPLIAGISFLNNSSNVILNRITENYMPQIAQNYDVTLYMYGQDENNPAALAFFQDRTQGDPIAANSHFLYSRDDNGRARYSGVFYYFSAQYGVERMLLCVESKSNREDRGYLSLLGFSGPGDVVIPQIYSYAKYVSDKLVTFKGDYAYPTIVSPSLKEEIGNSQSGHIILNGYRHFVSQISDDELIVISRSKIEMIKYIVELFIFGLSAFFLLTLISMTRKKPQAFEKNYYKSRINTVLLVSLVVTLVFMAILSVFFVYRRNNADMNTMMAGKINSIQALVQSRFRYARDYEDISSQEMSSALEDIGSTMKSDITIYTPSGKAFRTTTPEIFDRMIIGSRINEDALYNIRYVHKRYYIHKEKLASHKYYSLYAPVFSNQGNMMAIVCSPYTDQSYDLEDEAVIHIASIITVFLILLMIARFITTAVVDKMFKPLIEMGRKMNEADINHLEYIIYERDDEISTLVRAYNLMVHDLSNSTRQLAQAERDKAWSEMARQVAHEIKNSLTPIKLQIQRLIRLKQLNNPSWEGKFDEMSDVILEHIDILADTATEFSTFAKLYSEEPVRIDLDALIKEEILMFDNKENVTFSYMGLENAFVDGPKPQLTRVFVNLITNAIQAIDDKPGNIVISLRNSSNEEFYDIVIEDNGPGVKDENRAKLFTPYFTTKSRGTGLGLAICRNIIERCKGEIQYSRSFTLGGACFTIKYPKVKA